MRPDFPLRRGTRPRPERSALGPRAAGRKPQAETLEGRTLLATLFVATTGSDANAGGPAAPFASIQHAVTRASSGDVIKVAAGSYGYNQAADAEGGYTRNFGTTSVVTLINKQVAIFGGYTTADWNTYNPGGNQTVIDGANVYRGVLVVGGGQTATSLTMSGFTITRGVARGIPKRVGTNDVIDANGGGMLVELAPVSLHELFFSQNQAIGENTSQGVGGAAAGGGLSLRSSSNATTGTLQNVLFDRNTAQAGSGQTRGGLGHGGGLFSYQYTVNASNVTFTNNRAIAGSSQGSGFDGVDYGDAQGGGVAIHIGSVGNLTGVTAVNNQAIGGAAPNGSAGGAYGGGVYAERATLNLTASDVRSNTALGGNGDNSAAAAAGFANGGGLMTINTNTVVERTAFAGNTARGGNGATFTGVSGGGGVAFVRQNGFSTSASLNNSLIAGNTAVFGGGSDRSRGGGGGGLWINGPTTTITQSTIAGNQIVGSDPSRPTQQGQAIVVGPGSTTTVNLAYNIIADHLNNLNAGNGPAAALSVQPGSTANLNRNLFANNSNDSNAGSVPSPSGTYNGFQSSLFASSAGFRSSGSFDYHLTLGSPAVDAAAGSNQAVDITGLPRLGTPDIGAYERRSVPGDYDGDGRSDLAVYRPGSGQWIVRTSSDNRDRSASWGNTAEKDVPVPGDYYNQGRTDLAVYRPGTGQWIIRNPAPNNPARIDNWGDPSQQDVPVPGDYDNQGRTDLAIYRPGTGQWIIRNPDPNGPARIDNWGDPAQKDIPVPGDYDGDGRTDLAIYRPGTGQWILRNSSGGVRIENWGDPVQRDVPVPGDYDGDGRSDLAIYRPGSGQWIIRNSGGGPARVEGFGAPAQNDVPAGSAAARTGVAIRAAAADSVVLEAAGGVLQTPPTANARTPATQAVSPRVTRLATRLDGSTGSLKAWLTALDALESEKGPGLSSWR